MIQRLSQPYLSTIRPLETANMTDNYLVKTVAGTCVGFSFILVGMYIDKLLVMPG